DPSPANAACRLYLLEDDVHHAEMLSLRFSHHGYDVHCFTTTVELQQAVRWQLPDLLLIDVMLAEGALAGIDAAKKLREEFADDLPVVFMSARGDLAARLAAVRAGGVGYFLKPLDFDELFRRVDDLLQRKATTYKVMVVEDEEQQANTYSLILQQSGLVTRVLTQPLQILKELHEFQPDLILMDLYLPECTGIELMQLIRQDSAHYALPILIISSETDPAKHNAALSQGADLFLLKPIQPEQLVAAVSSRVGRARALTRRLQFLSQRDPLTGLLNQRALLGYLDQHLAELHGGQLNAALLYFEVDQYRALRDRLGLSVADLLLADLAARVKERLYRASRLAHFSDGSFCALLLDMDPLQARDAATTLCDQIAAGVFSTEHDSVPMTLSVGVSPLNARYTQAQDWLSAAALACDIARDAGGNRVEMHREAVDDLATRELHARCVEMLNAALLNDGFYCLYQPIASLRGKPIERYDVLLRAAAPDGREVPAGRIFQVAREAGLIMAIDRWVLSHVVESMQHKASHGNKTVFFLKLSAESLNDSTLAVWIEETLEKAGVNGQQLVFEFLESDVATSLRAAGSLFTHLRNLGCGIALEHYGASLNSSQLLKHVPVDYIKLDASFVRDLVRNQANRESVRNILQRAESSGAMVIAGFVEDAASLPVLWQCGVHFIQGNFLQAPDEALSFDFRGGFNA
ncbi:MAG: EAL domain-containing protein, partial [Gammaproteobacteria bacterium]|nr:EAL domain-containing protein [Gammaproteobacteria bacterium]